MVSLEYPSSTHCVSAGEETMLKEESPFHRELYRQDNCGVGRMWWVLGELVLTGTFGLSCKKGKGDLLGRIAKSMGSWSMGSAG